MSDDDLPRDAHLRASLRHAPDASIGPPASLSEAILAEARAKARTPGAVPAPRRHPLLALWSTLTQPAVGTAVAGLTVATVVGLMWWQGPGDEALPARAPATQSAPTPEAPPAPVATAADPAPAPAAVAPQVQKENVAKEKAKKTAEPAPTEGVQRRAPAPAPAAPPAPAAAVEAEVARPPAAAMPAPAPRPAPVEEEKNLADASPAGRVRAERAPRSEAARSAATSAAAAKSESARADRRANQQFVDAVAPDLAGLRATLSAQSPRWTWRLANENEARPVDAALIDWLTQVDTATRGTWRRVSPPDTPAGRELQLTQDGRVRHRLQLASDRITWLAEDGSAWQALLTPSLQEGPAR